MDNSMDTSIRSSRTQMRIQEMCRNGAGVPQQFRDNTVWAESDIRNGTAFHTGYRIAFTGSNEDGTITGTWQTVFVETLNEERCRVLVTQPTRRQPNIGVVHEFTIRPNGSVVGLPPEMIRHIFSWEY